MNYWLDLFTGTTWREFMDAGATISGFVDADIAEQANVFATVNLAQTKVNKSLVYDLFSLARARSPQKSCHKIAVALNEVEGSPLYRRIKRLPILPNL